MPRVNFIDRSKEGYVIFGDTKEVKNTLLYCNCWYKSKIKGPSGSKLIPGWTVTKELAGRVMKALINQGVKVYVNGE